LAVAFAAGWAIGAQSRVEDTNEVLRSLKAVRDSEEFRDLLDAVRSHVGHSLRSLADLVDRAGEGRAVDTDDLVERVRTLISRD
jgi:hypothetical protein